MRKHRMTIIFFSRESWDLVLHKYNNFKNIARARVKRGLKQQPLSFSKQKYVNSDYIFTMVVVDKNFWNVSKNIVPLISFHWKKEVTFLKVFSQMLFWSKLCKVDVFLWKNAAIGAVSFFFYIKALFDAFG